MILALNLNSAMKRLVLRETWVGKRMKAIRFLADQSAWSSAQTCSHAACSTRWEACVERNTS